MSTVRKESIVRLNIAFLCGGPVLSGALNGKTAFATIVKAVNDEPLKPTPLFLDFKEVEIATASYIRESVFALKSYFRSVSSKFYPVVANANASVYDEILLIANAKGDAILSCQIDTNESVSQISLIGQLDPKQKLTFDLVNELRGDELLGVDANQLMAKYGASEQTKNPTAWNNRLAGLVSKGLVREFTQGRSKYYRPLIEEVQ